jgi:hypothetical protein
MAGNTTNVVKGFRQVIQDLLVPELRSIKTEVEYMKKAIDANSQEIKSLRTEMTGRIEKLTEITLRLVERIDTSQKYAELSERLARVEEKSNL